MRSRVLALTLTLAALAGCQRPVVYVPVPPAPPVQPPEPPPPPPPPVPPTPPPSDVEGAVARIVLGSTRDATVAAFGRAADAVVPASEAGAETLRWFVGEFMVYATLRDGVVVGKGASRVGANR